MLTPDLKNPLWLGYANPLVEAVFLERPNRFVAFCDLNGTRVRVHVPDPGRLKELLIPGVQVYLEDFGDQPHRKTRYALFLVASPEGASWVSLNTQLPNKVVRHLLTQRQLPRFTGESLVKPEFTWGKSRFDFLLQSDETGQKRLLEVKSVTLVLDDQTALFPDAPTVRGTRHIRELIAARQSGEYAASVLFVIQRHDALRVVPNRQTDPNFCQAVSDAADAGVDFSAIAYQLTPEGMTVSLKEISVLTHPPVHILFK